MDSLRALLILITAAAGALRLIGVELFEGDPVVVVRIEDDIDVLGNVDPLLLVIDDDFFVIGRPVDFERLPVVVDAAFGLLSVVVLLGFLV